MSDASDSAQSPKLVDSAPEAKRRHHAPAPSPTKSGAALVAAPRAEKPPDAPAVAAPKREVTAADPVAEQHIRGALHSVCRSVDRYTKITQIGKGTYGLVSSRFLLHPFFFFLLVSPHRALGGWGYDRRVYKASYDHSDGRREYVALKKVRMEDEKEGVC